MTRPDWFTFGESKVIPVGRMIWEWVPGKINQVKYLDLSKDEDLIREYPSLSKLLTYMGPRLKMSGYEHTYVDVKLHHLLTGDIPCIPGWHTDLVVNPFSKEGNDLHYVYVSGQGCSRTEFTDQPMELYIPDMPDGQLLMNLRQQINNINPSILKIEDNTIYKFDRFNFHRGTPALFPGVRIMVRFTCTDLKRKSSVLGAHIIT